MTVTKRIRTKGGRKVTVYKAEPYWNGTRLPSRMFDTAAAAWTWHDEQIARRNRGGPSGLTFDELVDKYSVENVKAWQGASRASFHVRSRHFLDGPLPPLMLDEITPEAIDSWFDWLLAQPTRDSPNRRSFANELNCLSMIFNWWRNNYDARFVNPIMRRHRQRAKYKPLPAKRSDHFIRATDVLPFLDWLQLNVADPAYYRAALFQVLTGCRISEVAGLKWDAIDLRARTATIMRRAYWPRNGEETPSVDEVTKTKASSRIVRLSDKVVEMLAEIPEAQRAGLVFHHHGEIFNYGMAKYYFTKGFRKLGLPWSATHILRHSWATLGLVANNGNLAAIQAGLGHSTPDMTLRYAKVAALAADSTSDKLSAMLHAQDHAQAAARPNLVVINGR